MAVDLGKGGGNELPERRQQTAPSVPPVPQPQHQVVQPASGSTVAALPGASGLDRALRVVARLWPALWIIAFATGHWEVGLALLFLSGPLLGMTREPRLRARQRERYRRRGISAAHRQHALEHRRRAVEGAQQWRQVQGEWRYTGAPHEQPVAPQPAPAAPEPASQTPAGTSAAERSLAAVVVRAETSSGRLDAEALALVREADQVLRPLLASVRSRGADARVRHDTEAIAGEHLPAALDAFLALPDDYARTHRTSTGTTPVDEFRSQLTLLVEGCRQLRVAVLDADVSRQAELSRFLDAKFRRSDLDL